MNKQKGKYLAGTYSKHRPDTFMLAMQYIEGVDTIVAFYAAGKETCTYWCGLSMS